MTEGYDSLIKLGKAIAEERGLNWEIPLDEVGMARDRIGWDLTGCVGDVPPPRHYLRDLGPDAKTFGVLNLAREKQGLPSILQSPLSTAWQDLIKAAVIEQLFVKRNTTAHVYANIARTLRVIATCVEQEPWKLTLDDLNTTIGVAKKIQASGKLADLIITVTKVVFDTHHICEVGLLYPLLGISRIPGRSVKSKHTLSKEQLRERLEDRKLETRLPERRAFWELIRIVMTEKPRSFMDEMRFSAVQTMIFTGFRIGEAALLPADWRRERSYFDRLGQPAGAVGGISNSLMLRHFAEKQQVNGSDSRVLSEGAQPVPEMFREILSESLERIFQITQPLRATLKLQCETGRLLPWFSENDLVPFIDLYSAITGNPFWLIEDTEPYTQKYRESFSTEVLEEIRSYQKQIFSRRMGKLNMALYMFGNRLAKQIAFGETPLRFRNADGTVIAEGSRMSWPKTFVRIAELEAHIRLTTPTKVSDMIPLPLENGLVQPWEFLFLQPKRALAEERNDGICDVTRYISVGRPDPSFIGIALGDSTDSPSLFQRYGLSDEDRALSIESHTLRHLQNTELFRLGVADTIISKRFNRRSVAQSYEYDHRSLAEELDQINIPEDIEIILGGKATTVAKMIKSGRANGPIVDAFRRIQVSEGDAAAYEYLQVEADGFHATPYGHCLNSFTVDPCPTNLECFANCRHLSATDLPENRTNLLKLKEKFQIVVMNIEGRPSTSRGWKNQLAHAKVRLDGIQRLLETPPGESVFPEGVDLSKLKQKSLFDDEE